MWLSFLKLTVYGQAFLEVVGWVCGLHGDLICLGWSELFVGVKRSDHEIPALHSLCSGHVGTGFRCGLLGDVHGYICVCVCV